MYSPKIKEELIPKIYKIAKIRGIRMTTLVNEILGEALRKMEAKEFKSMDLKLKLKQMEESN